MFSSCCCWNLNLWCQALLLEYGNCHFRTFVVQKACTNRYEGLYLTVHLKSGGWRYWSLDRSRSGSQSGHTSSECEWYSDVSHCLGPTGVRASLRSVLTLRANFAGWLLSLRPVCGGGRPTESKQSEVSCFGLIFCANVCSLNFLLGSMAVLSLDFSDQKSTGFSSKVRNVWFSWLPRWHWSRCWG